SCFLLLAWCFCPGRSSLTPTGLAGGLAEGFTTCRGDAGRVTDPFDQALCANDAAKPAVVTEQHRRYGAVARDVLQKADLASLQHIGGGHGCTCWACSSVNWSSIACSASTSALAFS